MHEMPREELRHWHEHASQQSGLARRMQNNQDTIDL